VALSDIDRNLLERCLARKPRAWEDFVDRFIGLVHHVVSHTAQARSLSLSREDREDLCAAVFLEVVKDDFAVLRRFRRGSSLATYLAVIARRIVVRKLVPEPTTSLIAAHTNGKPHDVAGEESPVQRISDRDEVERLMHELEGPEAEAVRMYHLEGKSYREIGAHVGMAENSVGPMLTRARDKMRKAALEKAGS
jgi:RNA polymerase sigma-70 factor (ECF subfamily)